jgi:hypothetical protein
MRRAGAAMTEEIDRAAGQVFVRLIEIPPGAPWDQFWAARLDAAHGAPLGGDALVWAIRRLEPWRPRSPGRFAAGYVRREAIRDREVVVDAGGTPVRLRFAQPELRRRRVTRLALTGGLAAVALVAGGLGVQKALELRSQREQTLARLEDNAARWERVARRERRQAADVALLKKAGADRASFADLAADLFWLGQAKAPSVAIERVQWSRGEMRVVSVGPGRPVLGSERALEPVAEVAGAREWRIGGASPTVVRGGIARPSVVVSASERSSGGGT